MQEYVPKEIEAKWQKYWEEHNLLDFDFDSENPKFLHADHTALPFGRSAYWPLVCQSFCISRIGDFTGRVPDCE